MARGNTSGKSQTERSYVTINRDLHKFEVTHPDGTEGANIEKVTIGEKTYLKERFNSLKGIFVHAHLDEFTTKKGLKQETIAFDFKDVETGKLENLQLFFPSNQADSLINRLLSAKLKNEVEIRVFKGTRKDGVPESIITLLQENPKSEKDDKMELVPVFFNKDVKKHKVLGEQPQWKKLVVNNKEIWDKGEALVFQKSIVDFLNAEGLVNGK
jgi:hypothetical protein